MSAKILDGKATAAAIKQEVAREIKTIIQNGGQAPGLAVVLVGQDPASEIYVRNKRQSCAEVGINSFSYDFGADMSQADLLDLIDRLNQDPKVHGILVQLPLPKHIDSTLILERIDPNKDVDGFHPYNIGRLAQGNPRLRSCTPYGIMMLLERHGINPQGMDAVVVGASNIVGRPMALELLTACATVTVCHRLTKDLETHVRRAELLVVGIGHRGVIKSEWLKPGVIAVDVGMHRLEDGTVEGDLELSTAKERASWITPVPGGVGPMTVAMLIYNTWLAAKNIKS